MLINLVHDTWGERLRLQVAGIAMLALVVGLSSLAIAVYAKVFDSPTIVTLQTDRAGLQLTRLGDVRVDGALVGYIKKISYDDDVATVALALKPEDAAKLPANISAEIQPTTLFGQKFVALVRPAVSDGSTLEDGAIIPADRVETTVELGEVLDRLDSLLTALDPAQLSYTLTALDTALEGRGELLGQTIDDLGVFLDDLEPQLPTLREDLTALADVATNYAKAAPDVLGVLSNLTVTSRTVVDKKAQLQGFFDGVTGVSTTANRLLSDNETALIDATKITRPMADLLATYSPEFPCLIQGAAKFNGRLSRVFEGGRVKQFITVPTPQYRNYDESDRPVYGEVGHGPWCLGLPNVKGPQKAIGLDNGTDQDEDRPTGLAPFPLLFSGASSTMGGSQAEQQVINAMLASRSGRPAGSYGALGSLLYGPAVRTKAGTVS